MQLLSLSNFKHGMYIDQINPSVYWVNFDTRTASGGTRGALCLSLLNSSVTRSLSIVEKTYSLKLAPNLISFSSINLCLLSSKIVSSRVGMLHNVHNFDGIMQKTHTVTSFQLGEVARYLILWQMELMKHPWLILCTIKLMSQHFLYYFQTILSLFC